MAGQYQQCQRSSKNKVTVRNMPERPEDKDMTREDRRDFVLAFIADHDLALPPKAIYRNLRYKHNATFSYSAMRNYLNDLTEEGLLLRIEPAALEERDLNTMDRGRQQRAYYILTEEGKEEAAKLN